MPRQPEKQFSIRDILEQQLVACGETKLRQVIVEMGFKRPEGVGKYSFDSGHVRRIQEYLQSRLAPPRAQGIGGKITGYGGPSAEALLAKARDHIEKRRRTARTRRGSDD